MVACRGICKTYVVRERAGLLRRGRRREVDALRGVDLAVGRGEFVALLGRNGAGKTTLLKIVATLLLPSSGEVRVAGIDALARPREARRRIGLVLAGERTVYWKLTGRENLLLFAGLYGVPRREARARADALLARVGLREFRDVPAEKYSTGMRKRLALAKALVHAPEVLVLDEPTAGLDPQGVEALWRILRELRGERKLTVLLATHNMLEAEELPDRVVILDEGRIVAEGTPAEVKARAGAVPTAALTLSGPGPRLPDFGPGATLYTQDEGRWLLVVPAQDLPRAIARAQAEGLRLEGVQVKASTLWDAFLKLTGRPFDDLGEEREEA
ncbi:MAG: ABC transporter ATP-binding protein [Candidatus Bipolaricaulota bacterium]|nr:ABC transporter ATP-binding protein [Candidatus Bipolaricaulota bacterium]